MNNQPDYNADNERIHNGLNAIYNQMLETKAIINRIYWLLAIVLVIIPIFLCIMYFVLSVVAESQSSYYP